MARIGTYGLGTSVRQPESSGPGLADVAGYQQRQATAMLGQAAQQEQERNRFNQQIREQERAGRQQLGSTVGSAVGGVYAGATYGSAAGPWGAAIGGLVGALAGRYL